jgi:thioredoxin 1
MSILEVNDDSFHKNITKSGVTLVDFGAPWCAPCKVLLPILEQLDSKFDQQLTILTVNCEESPQVATQYGVMSMPTIIVFNHGEPVEKLIGLRPIGVYEQMVERYMVKSQSVR